jgi:hypothetical protein
MEKDPSYVKRLYGKVAASKAREKLNKFWRGTWEMLERESVPSQLRQKIKKIWRPMKS